MYNKLNYNLFYLLASTLIILSYFFGFYLNEDAAGGGKSDLYTQEWENINLFLNSKISSALIDIRYASSRTPLYLIINKFNPFITNIEEFRISYLFFATTIPILFFIFLKKNFKSINLNILIFLSCILMLSPYFRTMSFWADTEGLAIFFLLLSLITFTHLPVSSYENNKKKYYFIATLAIFFSFLSFYSDQKYIFLSIFIYFTLIFKNDLKFFFRYSLVCIIFTIPALYLFYIWGGVVPIESQFRIVFSPAALNYFLSIIGLYLLPIFIVLMIEKKIINLFSNLKKSDLIIFLIIAIILFFTLPESPQFKAVGIIFKFLSLASYKFNINWTLTLFIYYILNLFFLLLVLTFFKKNFKNYIFLVIYTLIFISTFLVYQQYVDPLFFLLIFCYFNFIDPIKVMNGKYIGTFFLFYFFMLIAAVYYRSVCSTYFFEAACKY